MSDKYNYGTDKLNFMCKYAKGSPLFVVEILDLEKCC